MEEQQIITRILKKTLDEGELRQSLEQMRLKPTYENGILLQMVRKAANGDLTAARYILDTAKAPTEEPDVHDLRSLSTEELLRLAGKGGDLCP